MITKLNLLDIEFLAFRLAKDYLEKKDEPIPAFYTCDKKKLDSCLNLPFQTAFGKDCYEGFSAKAAILFYSIIKNHPFENGNKRIAVTTLGTFSILNNRTMKIKNDKLLNISLIIADSHSKQMKLILEHLTVLFDIFIKEV